MLNHIELMGRVTREPMINYITREDGTSLKMAKYSLAVQRSYGNDTDFFDCVAYGKNADYVEKYLQKGLLLVVEGSIYITKVEKDNKVYKNVNISVTSHYPCQSIHNTADDRTVPEQPRQNAADENPHGEDISIEDIDV